MKNESDLTEEEIKEIEKLADHAELRLEGHIYLVQLDKEGKELLKSELDPELMLKTMVTFLSDAVHVYVDSETESSDSE